jgi:hypothetical protein
MGIKNLAFKKPLCTKDFNKIKIPEDPRRAFTPAELKILSERRRYTPAKDLKKAAERFEENKNQPKNLYLAERIFALDDEGLCRTNAQYYGAFRTAAQARNYAAGASLHDYWTERLERTPKNCFPAPEEKEADFIPMIKPKKIKTKFGFICEDGTVIKY